MPFSEEFIDVYELGIKPACVDAGGYCERVDEQIFAGNILERVYNQIAKADIIISEMTGRNPNVFYETGYAHALNKQVILLTQRAEDIPFDLKHYPHIIYDGKISKLKQQLSTRVLWCIEHLQTSLSQVDLSIGLSINEIPLDSKPTIPVSLKKDSSGGYLAGENEFLFELRLDFHNTGMRTIRADSFELGFLLPEEITPGTRQRPGGFKAFKKFKTIDGDIWNTSIQLSIFPDCWERIEDTFTWKNPEKNKKELLLRIFTELGHKDLPFILDGKKE